MAGTKPTSEFKKILFWNEGFVSSAELEGRRFAPREIASSALHFLEHGIAEL